ncbi:transcription elongation factor SPT4-like [Harmonia axyridis]|uniref:transcription elongation factor SPT4-like n=1 Tax=Harmonia axyridis TaxID=115357 RepID=UPI001E2768B4|nr:transcription elongation factor SPT4-like [Harmonia axyridis]XP_045477079.1 transcription elongation factor SPT4-like [Harmonia axyridis]
MSVNNLPDGIRGNRACIGCSLIKSPEQFANDGCENCESFLQFKENAANVDVYTSKNFTGMVGIMEPSNSWVCKWLRLDHCVPGMYAISVVGTLPPEKIKLMKALGIIHSNRDRSGQI